MQQLIDKLNMLCKGDYALVDSAAKSRHSWLRQAGALVFVFVSVVSALADIKHASARAPQSSSIENQKQSDEGERDSSTRHQNLFFIVDKVSDSYDRSDRSALVNAATFFGTLGGLLLAAWGIWCWTGRK